MESVILLSSYSRITRHRRHKHTKEVIGRNEAMGFLHSKEGSHGHRSAAPQPEEYSVAAQDESTHRRHTRAQGHRLSDNLQVITQATWTAERPSTVLFRGATPRSLPSCKRRHLPSSLSCLSSALSRAASPGTHPDQLPQLLFTPIQLVEFASVRLLLQPHLRVQKSPAVPLSKHVAPHVVTLG